MGLGGVVVNLKVRLKKIVAYSIHDPCKLSEVIRQKEKEKKLRFIFSIVI